MPNEVERNTTGTAGSGVLSARGDSRVRSSANQGNQSFGAGFGIRPRRHVSERTRRSDTRNSDVQPSKLVTEYRASAGMERMGGFEQNESLLNDVLECDFPVHDATLELSEDVPNRR